MTTLKTRILDTLPLSSEISLASDISTFVNTTATELRDKIAALEGFTTFLGVYDSVEELPTNEKEGCIAIVGSKEYIWGKVNGTLVWTELGDTTAEMAAIDELSAAVATLETTKADTTAVEASVTALNNAITAVETSLSGYDTVGSADAALTSAKAYTDEQIAVVEGEISSLTDVVKTKADKTEVDAAISAVNEYADEISATLTAADSALSTAFTSADDQIRTEFAAADTTTLLSAESYINDKFTDLAISLSGAKELLSSHTLADVRETVNAILAALKAPIAND